MYFFLHFGILKDRIERKGLHTAFKGWFGEKGKYYGIRLWTGVTVAKIIYILVHAISSICSLFVAILFLKYHEAYLCGLVVFAMSCTWFGSCYYFEEFSKDYNQKVTQRVEKTKQYRMEMQRNPGGNSDTPLGAVGEEKSEITLWDVMGENYDINLVPGLPQDTQNTLGIPGSNREYKTEEIRFSDLDKLMAEKSS